MTKWCSIVAQHSSRGERCLLSKVLEIQCYNCYNLQHGQIQSLNTVQARVV